MLNHEIVYNVISSVFTRYLNDIATWVENDATKSCEKNGLLALERLEQVFTGTKFDYDKNEEAFISAARAFFDDYFEEKRKEIDNLGMPCDIHCDVAIRHGARMLSVKNDYEDYCCCVSEKYRWFEEQYFSIYCIMKQPTQ